MELLALMVNGFKPLIIFAKKTPSEMFNWVLNTSLNIRRGIRILSKIYG